MNTGSTRTSDPRPIGLHRLIFIVVIIGLEAIAAVVVTRSLTDAMILAAGIGGLLLLVLAGSGAWLTLVLAASFVSTRVGANTIDMSVADVALLAGSLIALFKVDFRSPRVRNILVLAAIYLGALAVNVFAHTSRASVLEWLHRVALLVGALLVGIAIAQIGRVVLALRVEFTTAAVFATAAIFVWVNTGFAPVFVFGFHKNFVGPMLAMSALLVQTTWKRAQFSPPGAALLWLLLIIGLLATDSRGAMLALAAAMLVVSARTRHGRRRALLLAPVILGLVIYVGISIHASTTGVNDNRFNTVRAREAAYSVALDHYHSHPWFGAGLRWFKEPGAVTGEPHNAFISTLSETGMWGTFASLVLFGGALVLMWRVPGELASAAVSLLVFRILQGQVDIFWLAGTMTLPWIIVGLAAGGRDSDEEQDPELDLQRSDMIHRVR